MFGKFLGFNIIPWQEVCEIYRTEGLAYECKEKMFAIRGNHFLIIGWLMEMVFFLGLMTVLIAYSISSIFDIIGEQILYVINVLLEND
ncbi:hypothetical protein BGP_5075 [Beggiatoa sp. PS]|nr:hypothetical protein BGP_5075 [Beggiatoa sp. PS]